MTAPVHDGVQVPGAYASLSCTSSPSHTTHWKFHSWLWIAAFAPPEARALATPTLAPEMVHAGPVVRAHGAKPGHLLLVRADRQPRRGALGPAGASVCLSVLVLLQAC
jgi:hypothetical protein